MSSSIGGINMGAQLNPWLGFVYQSQAMLLTKNSGSTVYGGQRLNPYTRSYVSTASLAILAFSGTLSATVEYDENGTLVGETLSYGIGAYGLGAQLNVDAHGLKDFRIGLDDGLTLGVFFVGSLNVQIGAMYVFH